MTEFGEKEKSLLADSLGDEYTKDCLWCNSTGTRSKEFAWGQSEPWTCEKCSGKGRVPDLPTGLALIEECRKRGVFINHYANKEGYSVFCWLLNGEIPYDSDEEGGPVSPEDLEFAIAIAALNGLGSRYEF